MIIDFYAATVLIFLAIFGLVLYLDRKNIERSSVILIRRTKKGESVIKKIVEISPTFWKWVGNIGIVVGFAASAYIIYFILDKLLSSMITKATAPVLSLVLPSISSKASMGPLYLAVPFWYWIISIALLVIVHEGFHGIMTVQGKVKLKTLGWIFLTVIPLGAFVEPDEKALKKKNLTTRLRVYAAGSFANFIFGAIYALILVAFTASIFFPAGVQYIGVIEDKPAYKANMSLAGVITEIDGHKITTLGDLSKALEMAGENASVTVKIYNGTQNLTYTIVTEGRPEPEFSPNWFYDFIIGLESNFPGIVDALDASFGIIGGRSESWEVLQHKKKFWEYAMESNMAIKFQAEEKIKEIDKKLEGKKKPGFMGITNISNYNKLKPQYASAEPLIKFFAELLNFLVLLNIGVGLANLLPIGPLDGGRMWNDVLKEYLPEKKARIVMKIISRLTILIIVLSLLIPYINKLI